MVIVAFFFVGKAMAQRKWGLLDAKSGWFVSGAIGAGTYVGDADGFRRKGDRISIGGDAAVGKWLTPSLALRLQMGGYNMQGARFDKRKNTGVKEAWNYGFVHGDVMIDAMTLFGGVKEDRFYSFIPYAGLGKGLHTGGNKNACTGLTVGAVNKFRLSGHMDAIIELKGIIFPDRFDWVSGGRGKDGAAHLTAGFTYNF